MASEPPRPETSTTTVKPRYLTTLTVGRRTYRKVSKKDRRRRREYSHPELRLSNRWLAEAGVMPGDRVHVVWARPGHLVIMPARPQAAGDSATAVRPAPPTPAGASPQTPG